MPRWPPPRLRTPHLTAAGMTKDVLFLSLSLAKTGAARLLIIIVNESRQNRRVTLPKRPARMA